jgi:hypothetical protein
MIWVNWALEHVQIVIAILVAIGALIKKISAEAQRTPKKPNQPPAGARPQARPFDTEVAERARRIQDEIRQKIEARRRAVTQAAERPKEVQRGAYDPFTPEALQRQNPSEVPRPPELARAASDRALVIAQRLEAAKQREAKRKAKASANEDTISIKVAPIALIPSTGPLMPVHPLRETLTDPDEVRRAIILSEILRPPVALR